jgi:hypothetical protein
VRRNGADFEGLPSFAKGVVTTSVDNVVEFPLLSNVALPMSVRIIFKPTALVADSTVVHFSKNGDATLVPSFALGFRDISGGIFGFDLAQNTGRWRIDPTLLTVDEWNEVIITVDESNTVVGYVNGIVRADDPIATQWYASGNVSKWGARGNAGSAANEFIGDGDLFEIYNKVLTAEEVSNLYNDARYVLPQLEHNHQLGSELTTGWDTAAWWNTNPASYSWVEGVSMSNDGSGFDLIQKSAWWTSAKKYYIEYTVELVSGSVNMPYDGAVTADILSTPGVHSGSYYYIPGGVGYNMYIYSAQAVWTMTALSIKEVTVEPTSKILHVTAKNGVVQNLLSGDVSGDNLTPITDWALGTGVALDSDGNLVFTDDGSNSDITVVNIPGVKDNSTYQFILHTIASDNPSNNFRIVAGASNIPSGSVDVNTDDNGDSLRDVGVHVITLTNTTGDDMAIRLNAGAGTGDTVTIGFISLRLVVPEVTNTDVEVVKEGSIRVPRFDGSTSEVDCGDYNDLTGDITVLAWVRLHSKGASGRILDNGKLVIRQTANPINYYAFSSDNTTWATNSVMDIQFGDWNFVAWTRKADGKTAIYWNADIIASSADSGTPTAGTTNILIGNSAVGNLHDGELPETIVLSGLLTAAEISQYYTATKHLYGK